VAGPIALLDLIHALKEPNDLPARTSCHVAVDQRVRSRGFLAVELREQLALKPPHPGLIHSTRVVRHQPGQAVVNTGPAEIPAAIQRMEPRLHQVRPVTDVVQPRCRHKRAVTEIKPVSYTLRLSSHRLHVAPATRQPASKVTIGQDASFSDLRHGSRAYDSSHRACHRAALPN
jgi:hypothetical protein